MTKPNAHEQSSGSLANADTEQHAAQSLNLDLMSSNELAQAFSQSMFEVAAAIQGANQQIAQAIDMAKAALAHGGSILILGAGTSGRLAIAEAAECPPTFSTQPELVRGAIAGGDLAFTTAVEGAEDDEDAGRLVTANLGEHDLLIAVSASGFAPYVRAAIHASRVRKVATILICSNQQAIGLAEHTVYLATGPELLAGSTRLKAGTAAKAVLNAITTGAFAQLGRVYGQSMVEVKVTNQKLRRRAERLVAKLGEVEIQKASDLLDLTDNDVKAAILMAQNRCSAADAQALLIEHQRQLRTILK